MRLPVKHLAPLAALLLASASGVALARQEGAAAGATDGPAADYPVVVGDPYQIGGTTWTPSNQLNYDAVGIAILDGDLAGVSGAHKTLPLPSYVEVTSLETGRTILVRLVERGPMTNDTLLALSSAAAAQLGVQGRAPVRVRRVNPPEAERASLRSGAQAPERMATPESLLKVLRRKLAEQAPLMPPPSTPPAMPTSLPSGAAVGKAPIAAPPPVAPPKPPAALRKPPQPATPPPAPPPARAAPKRPVLGRPEAERPASKPATAKAAAPTAGAALKPASPAAPGKGSVLIQVGAFSTQERARKVAAQVHGEVSQSGRFWRVRLGPFRGSGEASAALEKVKAAGYSDARIQRAD